MALLESQYKEILEKMETETSPLGLEIAPFKIGWYNDALADKRFAFTDVGENTLAFVIISAPSMFEKAFVPFLREELEDSKSHEIKDPLDRCMKEVFLRVSRAFPDAFNVVCMHDFEISPITKRPKVLVQTAGHVSGAVRFYQKCDLTEETEFETRIDESQVNMLDRMKSSKVFPVCVHPKYGGWFALRGILQFKNVQLGESYLKQKDPPVILKNKLDIANLLYLFNDHWRDWRYRDVGMPEDVERYSDLQKEYFGTEPAERKKIVETKIKIPGTDKEIGLNRLPLTEKNC